MWYVSDMKILVFAGSTRKGSFNKKLAKVAAKSLRDAGGEVTEIDLKDFPMPFYDGDLEDASGIPEHAKRFKELLKSHQAFFISSPEYNSSFSAVLKNAVDWASRSEKDEGSLVAFKGKVAGIVSASPGALGGLRGLVHLRSVLGNIGVVVIPDQFALGKANEAFDDAGNLKDEKQLTTVKKLAETVVSFSKKLSS